MHPQQPSLTSNAGPAGSNAGSLDEVLTRSHLPALDGLRALAVATVIFGHSFAGAPGDLGVSAFFVLSGFLITWLLLRETDRTGRVDLKRFFLSRTFRIFPAYYAFLAVSITLDLVRGDSKIRPVIVPALLYGVNYFNALNGHPVNSVSHAWSLAVEEQFYLVWPLLFLSLVQFGRVALTWGTVALIGAVLSWRCIAYLQLGWGSAYVYNAFDTRFDSLAMGCLLAVAVTFASVRALAGRVSMSAWMPFVTIGLLLTSRLLAPPSYRYGLGFTIDAILIAILILQLLALHRTATWRWMDHRAAVFLGAISYPLYLYHQLGLGAGRRIASSLPGAAQLILGVALSVAVAAGSYYIIEKPALRLKKRFTDRPRGDVTAGLAPSGSGIRRIRAALARSL